MMGAQSPNKLKRLDLEIRHKDRSTCNDHQGDSDMPYYAQGLWYQVVL